MLGFSFSCTRRGGARLSGRRRYVGRKEGREGKEGKEGKERKEGREDRDEAVEIAWENCTGRERDRMLDGMKPWK